MQVITMPFNFIQRTFLKLKHPKDEEDGKIYGGTQPLSNVVYSVVVIKTECQYSQSYFTAIHIDILSF